MFIQRMGRIFLFLLLVSALQIVASAQQTQTPDNQNPPDQSTPSAPPEKPKDTEPKALGTPVPASTEKNPQDKNAGTSNDRLFFALPNFFAEEMDARRGPTGRHGNTRGSVVTRASAKEDAIGRMNALAAAHRRNIRNSK